MFQLFPAITKPHGRNYACQRRMAWLAAHLETAAPYKKPTASATTIVMISVWLDCRSVPLPM
jgi:hypothetical protein